MLTVIVCALIPESSAIGFHCVVFFPSLLLCCARHTARRYQDLAPILEATAEEVGSATVVVVSSGSHYQAVPGVGVFLTLKELNSLDNYSPFYYYGKNCPPIPSPSYHFVLHAQ